MAQVFVYVSFRVEPQCFVNAALHYNSCHAVSSSRPGQVAIEAPTPQLDKVRNIVPAADLSKGSCSSGDSIHEASLTCRHDTCVVP